MFVRTPNWTNKFLFWASYNIGATQLLHPPLVINLEPTNHCNLRCPFCPVSQNVKNSAVARGFISMDLVLRLSLNFRIWRPMVAINLGGESTLHENLPEMVRILADAGCYVFLDTNAIILTEVMADKLVQSGLSEIVFCIDGEGDAESYTKMRRRGHLDRAVANARYFIQRSKQNPSSKIKTVVKNIRYYNPEASFEVPLELRSQFIDAEPDFFRASWADYWPGDHAERLTENYQVEPFQVGFYRPCTNLWKKLAISWDGKVFACCLDLNRTVEIGDLNHQEIAEIWNGAPMRAMRKMHRENRQQQSALCRSCTMVQRKPRSRFAGVFDLRAERFTPFSDKVGRNSNILR